MAKIFSINAHGRARHLMRVVAPRLICFGALTLTCTHALAQTPPATGVGAASVPRPAPAHAAKPAAAPQSPAAPHKATAVVAATTPVAQPRRVATVVHRLSGWKFFAGLAAERGSRVVTIEDMPAGAGAHANVVAGYVAADGRTVVAHLPQAALEASARQWPTTFFGGGSPAPAPRFDDSEFLIVRGDGAEFKANFIGLDASTGLSVLQTATALLTPAPAEATPAPPALPLSEGQRVLLYAPEPAPPAAAAPAVVASAPAVAPSTRNETPSSIINGDSGFIYSAMGAVEGRLAEVRRASATNRTVSLTVRAARLSSERAGAVAFDASGALLGIVTAAGEGGQAKLVPAEAVSGAARRVLERKSSVPRPWLGARGDALAAATLEKLYGSGWAPGQASTLLNRRAGVLLTAVAPGAPAELAGLRPGDVVFRVGDKAVGGVEDFTYLLDLAGAGSKLNLSVLRAGLRDPFNIEVTLGGATESLFSVRAAEVAAVAQRVAGAAKLSRTNFAPLSLDGLKYVGLSAQPAQRFGARAGLLVVGITPGSRAASAGLRPGDVIETANGVLLDPSSTHTPVLPTDASQFITLGVVRGGRPLTLDVKPATTVEREK